MHHKIIKPCKKNNRQKITEDVTLPLQPKAIGSNVIQQFSVTISPTNGNSYEKND
jgi:hypothetical protein